MMAEFSYSQPIKTKIPPRLIRRRRLLLFVPAVFLVIFFLSVLGYKATARRRMLTDYIRQTNSIAKQSNKVAIYLENQLKEPTVKSKASFKTKLMDMVQECQNLRDHAENMVVPEDLRLAQGYFFMAMKLRYKGMELYKPPIFEAISSNSPTIDEGDISSALRYLALSDLAYENFIEELNTITKGERLGVKVLRSQFLKNNAIYEKENILKFITALKGEDFKDTGDLAVLDVATEPLRISINTETDVRVLPDTDVVNVRIEVKNKGKTLQKDIPVEAELVTEGKKQGAKKQMKIDEILPDGTAKVSLEGFDPVRGVLNIFKIKVGPLFGEENTGDNYYEYKFQLGEAQGQQEEPAVTD
jgi:hypothetical protein